MDRTQWWIFIERHDIYYYDILLTHWLCNSFPIDQDWDRIKRHVIDVKKEDVNDLIISHRIFLRYTYEIHDTYVTLLLLRPTVDHVDREKMAWPRDPRDREFECYLTISTSIGRNDRSVVEKKPAASVQFVIDAFVLTSLSDREPRRIARRRSPRATRWPLTVLALRSSLESERRTSACRPLAAPSSYGPFSASFGEDDLKAIGKVTNFAVILSASVTASSSNRSVSRRRACSRKLLFI